MCLCLFSSVLTSCSDGEEATEELNSEAASSTVGRQGESLKGKCGSKPHKHTRVKTFFKCKFCDVLDKIQI